ncbi:MAG: ribD, partial [Glaciihabitans sp.]|nr:ribD [Glaciihabitans sp.]
HLRNHPAGLIETHSRDLPAILEALFQRGIRRAFVEGGPQLASALIAADLVDEYAVYLAPSILGGSGLAIGDIGVPSLSGIKHLDILGVEQLGNDLLVRARARPRVQPASHPHPAATPQPATSTTAGTAASTTATDSTASTSATRTTTER